MLQPRDCHFHSLSAHGFHRVAYRDSYFLDRRFYHGSHAGKSHR